MGCVPELRFKEFSGDWEEKKLEDMTNFISSGKTIDKIGYGEYNVYGSRGIIGYTNNPDYNGKFILVARVGANAGKLFLINEKCGISDNTLIMKFSLENIEEFYLYLLENFNLNKLVFGSGQPLITGKQLKNLLLRFPKIKEQEKIANFLSKIDEKIAILEEKLQLWETYKKGIIQKLFSQQLRFTDDDGNDYPVWEEKKLNNLVNFFKGKGISKNDISEEGTECVRYGELYTTYNEKISEIVSKTNLPKEELVLSEKYDIIIPTSGETAIDLATASCIMKEGVAIGGDTNILKTKENSLFLSYYLNNKQNEIASLAQGVSVVHLYASSMKKLRIKIPSIEEQEKIANFLTNIDEKIEKIANELRINKEFKKGLLKKMFC